MLWKSRKQGLKELKIRSITKEINKHAYCHPSNLHRSVRKFILYTQIDFRAFTFASDQNFTVDWQPYIYRSNHEGMQIECYT
jgi:hypothetical protein